MVDCITTDKRVCLSQAIERSIERRTCRRVHDLHVEVSDNRVMVDGATESYYIKQLAIQGVFEILRSADGTEVMVNIQVISSTYRTDSRVPVYQGV
jgi:hypothetical protein